MRVVSDNGQDVVLDTDKLLGINVHKAPECWFLRAWLPGVNMPLVAGSEQRCRNGLAEFLRHLDAGADELDMAKVMGPRPELQTVQGVPDALSMDDIARLQRGG